MITQYMANKLQDYVFGRTAYTPSTTYYVGLSKATINYNGTGLDEPVGNNYSRVAIANDKTNWTNSSTGIITNKVRITFPESTGDWGTCTYIFIADALTGGNILFASPLNIPRNVQSYAQIFYDIGGLEFTLTNS